MRRRTFCETYYKPERFVNWPHVKPQFLVWVAGVLTLVLISLSLSLTLHVPRVVIV